MQISPPPYGRTDTVIHELSQNLRNRRHRWQQLQLDITQSKTAALLDFLELYQTGYETKLVKRAWLKSRSTDQYYTTATTILHLVLDLGKRKQKTWNLSSYELDVLFYIRGVDSTLLKSR